MRYKRSHRLRRFLASGSPLLFAGAVAIASVVLATLRSNGPGGTAIDPVTKWVLLAVVLAGVVLLAVQMWFEYRKRTYEPTWAIKFGEMFESEDTLGIRSRAANSLQTNSGKLGSPDFSSSDLDALFDFFESLGFYMSGDQISPEVARHWYHHWILGYYSAGHEYLAAVQKEEPTQWRFVKILLDATNEIEFEQNKSEYEPTIKGEKLNKFLSNEIHLI